ncbi:MAG: 2-oxoglutarate dehydrogenase component [Thermoleophilaceae bacterium]|jgi:2-oxoglutarate dehydrogenase E1 component|nr:2-oxoglutarate dehydrogenase component [Thermoleophilaceae bacterium]
MPEMGESVTEGTVLDWLKQEGDQVEAEEGLVEVSTDKVDTEVPSPASGVLTKILVGPDETVPVGTPLAEIEVGATGSSGNGSAPAGGEQDGSVSDEGGATQSEAAATEALHMPEPGGSVEKPVSDENTAEIVDLPFPEMGESVTEGTVLEWLKQVGDPVELEEGIVEVSTDKVDTEVPSPAAGTLAEILVAADETVPVGTVLCRIAVGAAGAPAPSPAADNGSAEATATPEAPAATDGNGNATPVAGRMAGAHGIDVSSLAGSGRGGKVIKADVQAAIDGNGASAPAAAPASGESQLLPIRGPAATLARFMNESRSIPTATSFRTVPVTALDARRRSLKDSGKKLSFTHLIAWAIVQAAKDWPVMAHAYTETDGKPQRIDPGGVSLGLAVDAERKDGTRTLLVPVIRNAHLMDFNQFVAEYDEKVFGARDNKLSPEAYAGANITLTNPGGLGTVASVPRLMPGQGTIIATGSIAFPPGLAEVSPAALADLGVAKVMTMTSTYDHRVIQGAESGSFLRAIDQLLQGDNGFYEEIFGALGVALGGLDGSAAASGPTAMTADEPAPAAVIPEITPGTVDEGLLQAVQAATSVVKAHRMHGHLAARLDPLGHEPPGDPALDPATVNLTQAQMEQIPASVLRIAVPGKTFADALPRLQETYCGTIAYEIEHISEHEHRIWLRQAIESGAFRPALDPGRKRALLERLSQVEALETYFHKAFLGKKSFSVEGLDMLLPMLDETIELASAEGAREVVLGMAHRGRLNVLAHTVGKRYESLLVEFEVEKNLEALGDTALPSGGTGDVKYHLGAMGTYRTTAGKGITIRLAANPSHLEYVNPVVEGRARADQTSRKGREPVHDPSIVLPVLIHGDAAFPGQGVVSETLNLQSLDGYSTGGTVHVITNNQVGFTTDPHDSRSTRYASDPAKGFDVPIIHVNADDVEACISAAWLAFAYRERFRRDALIDLIGYRRLGHNEQDEPAYTQPHMYDLIKKHPTVRKLYADKLIEQGVLTPEEADKIYDDAYKAIQMAHSELKEQIADHHDDQDTGEHELDRTQSREPRTAVPAETLKALNRGLVRVPEGFTIHRKLKPQLEKRITALEEDGPIEWAHAEALALGSLLEQGIPIRFTGQDTERGTFSQRHLVLHDEKTGDAHTPIQNLRKATVPLELHNSPLSEVACLGFEYGYAAHAPEALVIWEAQFGDFVNSAQVIVDQFIVSGQSKWGIDSRLTMLLPHGYEGAGPEHSSARLERFLSLSSEGNIRIANCTTPAQYFHLLRRQAMVDKRRPLVVLTPKGLLRLPLATSRLVDLAEGQFQPVLDDPTLPGSREDVTRLVLCSGRLFYDLAYHEARAARRHIAIGRVELLYPFAKNELRSLLESFPNLRQVVWAQEEPQNMGARKVMWPRLRTLLPDGVEYQYVGRPLRASPGEGYAGAHLAQQRRIVRAALEIADPNPPTSEFPVVMGTPEPGTLTGN